MALHGPQADEVISLLEQKAKEQPAPAGAAT
jgi:hypothetical protein